ncbi:MAG: enoyl-CoA hydratase/isomerase family protein [Myxococcales bacterium]|nr:enoyl-CoA hydratase/isomerase family protein [Myxococcales bacterium]
MTLKRERRARIEIVTLDRPEVRNAFNAALAVALYDCFEEIDRDDDVRAVVLTGAGDKSFSTGADLKALSQGDPTDTGRGITLVHVCRRGLAKPLIAAVGGTCLAGGLELALACDLIVADEAATFGLPEAKRGMLAGAGGVARVCQRIGLAPALEIVMTGDPIDARRAYELGLINRVVEREALLDTAVELAERIAENAPLAVQRGKQLAREVIGASEEETWALSDEARTTIMATEDAREGPRAFAEKRPPVWKGR